MVTEQTEQPIKPERLIRAKATDYDIKPLESIEKRLMNLENRVSELETIGIPVVKKKIIEKKESFFSTWSWKKILFLGVAAYVGFTLLQITMCGYSIGG